MFINFDLLIWWCAFGASLTAVYFISKKIALKHLSIDDDGRAGLDKGFRIGRDCLIAGFVISLIISFLFFGTGVSNKQPDMGAAKTLSDSEKYVAQTQEEISVANTESLVEKENTIRKEVAEAQRKSSEDYEKFIKESLKQ